MRNTTAITVSFILAMPLAAQAAAPSPLVSLSEAEKSYYEKIFDYSMDTVKPGQKYNWSTYGGKGMISIGETYISKSGATCRNFSETFNVQGHNGIDEGVGCKRRGQDGWCKLDLSKEAKTCSFEDTTRMFGGMSIDTPSINAPAIPAVNMPNMPSRPNAPSVNYNVGNVNTPSKDDLTPKGYANSVTGNAGKAAGSAAGSTISWFGETFLR